MPWTVDNPPKVAKNWNRSEIAKCVSAANAVLDDDSGDEIGAIQACVAAAGKSDNSRFSVLFKGMDKTYDLDVEVFAVGKWKGMLFKSEDLKSIVEAFKNLKELHRVPLKFGHNDEQPMIDGEPALGWVDDVWIKTVDGVEKLFARFTDIPALVYNAMKKKLYRNVSIELDFDVVHKGSHYPLVLSGVALLGADIPAVNVLADLTAYMGRSSLAGSRRAVFSSADYKPNQKIEGEIMDITKEEYDRLQAEAKKADQFKREAESEKSKREEFERKEQERKEQERKDRVAAKRNDFTKVLDDAVKGMKITPAQKESFTKVLKLDDDEAVDGLDLETVKGLIGASGADEEDHGKKFNRETSKGGGKMNGDDDLDGKDPGEKLDFAARRLMGEDAKLTYSRALDRAMAAHPDLARDHINATYNEEG